MYTTRKSSGHNAVRPYVWSHRGVQTTSGRSWAQIQYKHHAHTIETLLAQSSIGCMLAPSDSTIGKLLNEADGKCTLKLCPVHLL